MLTLRWPALSLLALALLPALSPAEVVIPADTRVYLSTREHLLGKGGRVSEGQLVRCEVWRDIVADGRVVIAAGTPAMARVDTLKTRKVAGIKGKMTLGALETEAVDGSTVQLAGGYYKEGKGRIALSASLSALVAWPLIFIPGAPAELPEGTVFDAYTARRISVDAKADARRPVIDLTGAEADMTAELLYERLENVKKPKKFEFAIDAPGDAPEAFVIDTVNGQHLERALELKVARSTPADERKRVEAEVSIKKLSKHFKKGINTIEIAYTDGAERVATEVVIEIQI